MKTFNKNGDKGEASLLFERRIPKSDLRCEAYGTIDEAVSFLGMARHFTKKDKVGDTILKVQKELFTVNAELATKPEDYERLVSNFKTVTDKMANGLEEIIDEIEAEIEMPESFIIPGSNLGSASLDMSRTIVRRAERKVVILKQAGEIKNDAILQYLNRLSDLFFALARYEEN